MDHAKGLTGIWATVHAMNDEDHAPQVSQSHMGTTKVQATRRILPSLMEELDIVRRTEQTAHEIQSLNALLLKRSSSNLNKSIEYMQSLSKRQERWTTLTSTLRRPLSGSKQHKNNHSPHVPCNFLPALSRLYQLIPSPLMIDGD